LWLTAPEVMRMESVKSLLQAFMEFLVKSSSDFCKGLQLS